MNLTDQEKFCQVLGENEWKALCFPRPDSKSETYLEDTKFQACLAVYTPENVNDVRRNLDTVMTEEEFEQLKEECVKAIMKSLLSQGEGGQDEGQVKDTKIRIPEFIYTF